jgi:hypothetical protein
MNENDDILTPEEAYHFLKLNGSSDPHRTMVILAAKHKVPARKAGREWRFSRGKLAAWVSEGETRIYVDPRTHKVRAA